MHVIHSTVNIIPGHNNSLIPSQPKYKNSVNTFPEIILSKSYNGLVSMWVERCEECGKNISFH